MGAGRLGRRRELRQPIERGVELERGPATADPLDRLHHLRGNDLAGEKFEVRVLSIDVGGDRPGFHELPVLKRDTGREPVVYVDRADVGPGSDRRAEMDGGPRHRLGDTTHPALRESPDLAHALQGADVVVRENVCRSRGARADHLADHGVGRERDLDLVRLEPLVQEVLGGEQEEVPDELLGLRPRERRDEVRERDRGSEQERLDEVEDPIPELLVLGVGARVLLGEFRDLALGLLRVVPERDAPSVGERTERLGVVQDRSVPVLAELEVLGDLRSQESCDVRERVDAEPGPRLFGDHRAAHERTLFEDHDLRPGLGEVAGRDQAVVPSSDDRDVVIRHLEPGAGTEERDLMDGFPPLGSPPSAAGWLWLLQTKDQFLDVRASRIRVTSLAAYPREAGLL